MHKCDLPLWMVSIDIDVNIIPWKSLWMQHRLFWDLEPWLDCEIPKQHYSAFFETETHTHTPKCAVSDLLN